MSGLMVEVANNKTITDAISKINSQLGQMSVLLFPSIMSSRRQASSNWDGVLMTKTPSMALAYLKTVQY